MLITKKKAIPVFQKANDGFQQKWESNGIWTKLDSSPLYSEGLCESVASRILEKSNVEHAIYTPCIETIKGTAYCGCKSRNFIPLGSGLLLSMDLMEQLDMPLSSMTPAEIYANPRGNMEEFINKISTLPGIEEFDKYVAKMLRFDAIIRNGDRTFFNIAVLRSGNGKSVKYSPAPLFDHGQSFMMHNSGWKKGISVEDIAESGTARPFCYDFEKQAQYAEDIAGGPAFETTFDKKDLDNVLSECAKYYPEEATDRIRQSALYLMDQYAEYFHNHDNARKIQELMGKCTIPGFEPSLSGNSVILTNSAVPGEQLMADIKGNVVALYNGTEIPWTNLVLEHGNLLDKLKILDGKLHPKEPSKNIEEMSINLHE